MLAGTRAFLRDKLPQGATLAVAVSGGLDSMTLAFVLEQLGYRLQVLHCNFGLRGAESDADEVFIQSFFAKKNIAVETRHFDAAAFAQAADISIQTAARRLRYAWFDEYETVATAHHRYDNAETILYSLLRGKNFNVLESIPAQRGRYIRPFLWATRPQIAAFAAEHTIPFREDSSNSKDDYLRNRIRHHVMPELAAIHPDAAAQLAERAAFYRKQAEVLRAHLHARRYLYIKEGVLSPAISDEADLVLHEWLEARGLTFAEIGEVLRLRTAQVGAWTTAAGCRWTRERAGIAPTPDAIFTEALPLVIATPPFAGAYLGRQVEVMERAEGLLDADRIRWPLTIRRWRAGDRLNLQDGRYRKKVSDLLTEHKIPTHRKADVLVAADADKILYVEGVRVSGDVAARADTQRYLRLILSRDDL